MKFIIFFASTLLAVSVALTLPVDDFNRRGIFDRNVTLSRLVRKELSKRKCKPLPKSQCTSNPIGDEKSGAYCGYCVQVYGQDANFDDHVHWAYRIDVKTGECCSYGRLNYCSDPDAPLVCPIYYTSPKY